MAHRSTTYGRRCAVSSPPGEVPLHHAHLRLSGALSALLVPGSPIVGLDLRGLGVATAFAGAGMLVAQRRARRRLRRLLDDLQSDREMLPGGQPLNTEAETTLETRPPRSRDDEWSEIRRTSAAMKASLKRVTAQVEFAATHDVLTGLPNRRGLGRLLDERGASAAVVFFIDLDQFKLINDGLGPEWGDALLIAVASRLGSAVRATDLIGRIAGDEFVVVLDGSPGGAIALENAERVAEDLSRPYVLAAGAGEVRCVQINASIGVASTSVASPDTLERMIGRADLAMHEAKRLGGSRVLPFRDELADRRASSVSLTADLSEALARGELVNHYQPIVRSSDHRRVGYEALLRWDQPGHGIVPPGVFLDAAAVSGLLRPIGRDAIRRACIDCHELRRTDPNLSVAVNVSAVELVPALIRLTEEALAASGLDPGALHIEITESVLMADVETSARRLRDLRQLGVHVALDDFGTGYSSLAYLAEFPFDAVKIDQSFVARLGRDDAPGLSVVRSITRMCHDLGHLVVAEGVETRAQAETLASVGVDQLQGWFFGRPAPLSEHLAGDGGALGPHESDARDDSDRRSFSAGR